MTYTISKRFDFCASHILEGLLPEHQCGRLHGHNYSVTMHLRSQALDSTGFVRDYGELDHVKITIDTILEHRHLNEVFDFNPTAENIARWFYWKFEHQYPELYAVTVKETDKTEARYEPSEGN